MAIQPNSVNNGQSNITSSGGNGPMFNNNEPIQSNEEGMVYVRNRKGQAYQNPSQVEIKNKDFGNVTLGYGVEAQNTRKIFSEPEIEHPTLIKPIPKKMGKGCNPFAVVWGLLWGLLLGIVKFLKFIKNLIFSALLIIFLTVFALILILIYRPPFFWDPIKDYVNNDIAKPNFENITTETTYKKINETALKNIPVLLDNSEITGLVREFSKIGENCFTISTDNNLEFYINIDNSEKPLWFRVRTTKDDQDKINILKVGFGRFDTPQQLTGLLTETMGQLFVFLEQNTKTNSATIAFEVFLEKNKIDSDLQLLNVEFKQGHVVLYYQNNSPKELNFNY